MGGVCSWYFVRRDKFTIWVKDEREFCFIWVFGGCLNYFYGDLHALEPF